MGGFVEAMKVQYKDIEFGVDLGRQAGHVKFATNIAISELDASFFRVRFDRLTPAEKRYLRAMAEIDLDSCRSGDIAQLRATAKVYF